MKDKRLHDLAIACEPGRVKGGRSIRLLGPAINRPAIEETAYLVSVPGMQRSLSFGVMAPMEECDQGLAR